MKEYPILLLKWGERIPKEALFLLRVSLEKLQESAFLPLANISLKDPLKGLVFGIFFGSFGVDRFYKGDIWIGILKIFLHLIFAILCLSLGSDENFTLEEWGDLISLYIVIVWFFASIDGFSVYRGIKKDNLQKIQDFISLLR